MQVTHSSWGLGIPAVLNFFQFSQDTMISLGLGAFHAPLLLSPTPHICPPIKYQFRCLIVQEGFSGECFWKGSQLFSPICNSTSPYTFVFHIFVPEKNLNFEKRGHSNLELDLQQLTRSLASGKCLLNNCRINERLHKWFF